jgi:Tfp pilus assembly protein PilN
MIEINLIAGERKKKPTRRQAMELGALATGLTGHLGDRFMIVAIVVLSISGVAIGLLFMMQMARESSLTVRHETAIRDSTRYASVLAERYRIEAARDSLIRQVNLIQNLDEDRYVWPHIMDEVSRALPQYTWLTSVSFTGTPQGGNNVVAPPRTMADTSAAAKKVDRAPKRLQTTVPKDVVTVRITGRTADIQAVTRFMRDLESSPFLGNVVLEKSELAVDQGKEVSQFQLTVGYKRPDTRVLHLVALSPSVR